MQFVNLIRKARISYRNQVVLISVVMSCQLSGVFGETPPKKFIKSQIKELSGKTLIDSGTEVTQTLQLDKQLNMVGISTPTTPSVNHANLWLNNTSKQVCAV